MGKGRRMLSGQQIHASVAFCRQDYRPKAILSNNLDLKWDEIVDKGDQNDLYWVGNWEGILEMDMFNPETAASVLRDLESRGDNNRVWLRRLKWMSLYRKSSILWVISIGTSQGTN